MAEASDAPSTPPQEAFLAPGAPSLQHLKTGDLLLFNRDCTKMGGPLGWAVCSFAKWTSEYDHVAMVHVNPDDNDKRYVLEANFNGVTYRPLESRLHREHLHSIAVRPLLLEENTDETLGGKVRRASSTKDAAPGLSVEMPRRDAVEQSLAEFTNDAKQAPYKSALLHFLSSAIHPPEKTAAWDAHETMLDTQRSRMAAEILLSRLPTTEGKKSKSGDGTDDALFPKFEVAALQRLLMQRLAVDAPLQRVNAAHEERLSGHKQFVLGENDAGDYSGYFCSEMYMTAMQRAGLADVLPRATNYGVHDLTSCTASTSADDVRIRKPPVLHAGVALGPETLLKPLGAAGHARDDITPQRPSMKMKRLFTKELEEKDLEAIVPALERAGLTWEAAIRVARCFKARDSSQALNSNVELGRGERVSRVDLASECVIAPSSAILLTKYVADHAQDELVCKLPPGSPAGLPIAPNLEGMEKPKSKIQMPLYVDVTAEQPTRMYSANHEAVKEALLSLGKEDTDGVRFSGHLPPTAAGADAEAAKPRPTIELHENDRKPYAADVGLCFRVISGAVQDCATDKRFSVGDVAGLDTMMQLLGTSPLHGGLTGPIQELDLGKDAALTLVPVSGTAVIEPISVADIATGVVPMPMPRGGWGSLTGRKTGLEKMKALHHVFCLASYNGDGKPLDAAGVDMLFAPMFEKDSADRSAQRGGAASGAQPFMTGISDDARIRGETAISKKILTAMLNPNRAIDGRDLSVSFSDFARVAVDLQRISDVCRRHDAKKAARGEHPKAAWVFGLIAQYAAMSGNGSTTTVADVQHMIRTTYSLTGLTEDDRMRAEGHRGRRTKVGSRNPKEARNLEHDTLAAAVVAANIDKSDAALHIREFLKSPELSAGTRRQELLRQYVAIEKSVLAERALSVHPLSDPNKKTYEKYTRSVLVEYDHAEEIDAEITQMMTKQFTVEQLMQMVHDGFITVPDALVEDYARLAHSFTAPPRADDNFWQSLRDAVAGVKGTDLTVEEERALAARLQAHAPCNKPLLADPVDYSLRLALVALSAAVALAVFWPMQMLVWWRQVDGAVKPTIVNTYNTTGPFKPNLTPALPVVKATESAESKTEETEATEPAVSEEKNTEAKAETSPEEVAAKTPTSTAAAPVVASAAAAVSKAARPNIPAPSTPKKKISYRSFLFDDNTIDRKTGRPRTIPGTPALKQLWSHPALRLALLRCVAGVSLHAGIVCGAALTASMLAPKTKRDIRAVEPSPEPSTSLVTHQDTTTDGVADAAIMDVQAHPRFRALLLGACSGLAAAVMTYPIDVKLTQDIHRHGPTSWKTQASWRGQSMPSYGRGLRHTLSSFLSRQRWRGLPLAIVALSPYVATSHWVFYHEAVLPWFIDEGFFASALHGPRPTPTTWFATDSAAAKMWKVGLVGTAAVAHQAIFYPCDTLRRRAIVRDTSASAAFAYEWAAANKSPRVMARQLYSGFGLHLCKMVPAFVTSYYAYGYAATVVL